MHPSSSYSEYSKFNILLSHLLGKEGVNIERQILITFLMHDSSKSYCMELYFINTVTNIYLCGSFFSSMLIVTFLHAFLFALFLPFRRLKIVLSKFQKFSVINLLSSPFSLSALSEVNLQQNCCKYQLYAWANQREVI